MIYPDESKAMTEIRIIREQIARETEGMSDAEYVAYIKKGAAAAEKEFGLNLPRWKKADETIPTR